MAGTPLGGRGEGNLEALSNDPRVVLHAVNGDCEQQRRLKTQAWVIVTNIAMCQLECNWSCSFRRAK